MVIKDSVIYYKGFRTFYLGLNGLECIDEPIEKTEFYKSLSRIMGDKGEEFDLIIQNNFSDDVYDLIPGKEFLDSVKSACFIDYDGYIDSIYVDGYKTNLGLICKGLCSGSFLVNESIFKKLLSKHDVKVNWVNK